MPYIDTRDLYRRQCELESEIQDLEDAIAEWGEEEETESALFDMQEELEKLKEEKEKIDDVEMEVGSKFMYGTTLIPESKFEDYAQELASDLYGREISEAAWPFDCIDWEQAADALLMDYSSLEYDGETYYFRG